MNNDHFFKRPPGHIKLWRIKDTLIHLELALIGATGKVREEINKAIDQLSKYEEEFNLKNKNYS